MLLTPWLRLFASRMTYLRLLGRGRARRAETRFLERNRVSRHRPLAFERLEERTLLSTLTVNSALDNTTAGDGLVTLREAILAANSAGVTTDLGETSSAVAADLDLIVFGDGSGVGGTDFTDGTPDTIRLALGGMAITSDLTITGLSAASTIIDADPIAGPPNTATSRIFTISGTDVDVTLDGLTLQNGNSGGSVGGAILSTANLTSDLVIQNSTLSSNSGLRGGAIYSSFGDVTLTSSTLSGNSTSGEGGAITLFNGDLIVTDSTLSGNSTSGTGAEGGAIAALVGNVEVIGSTLSGNSTAGGSAHGGAIWARDGSVTVTDTTLSGNSAAGPAALGGAIYADAGAVTVTDSTLSGNSADSGGGAIYSDYGNVTVTSSTLSGNSAGSDGGAIYSDNGNVTVTNSTLSGNTAGHDGGAIDANDGLVDVTNSTLSGNSAGYGGGAIYAIGGLVTVTNSTLSGNSANEEGGAIYSRSGDVTVTSSTLSGNTADDGGGGAIYGLSASITVVNSTLSGNRANYGYGGAIYTESSEIRVINSTITLNYATVYAGGVYGSNVTIVNSIVAGNTTDYGNPDIGFRSALTVSHSLIGDNSGTGLTANPDASAANDDTTGPATHTRSFIGTGNFSAEQIGLAPLAFNGGPTMTHALLSTSLALNSGRDDLALDADDNPLVNDQRGAPFTRFAGTVDMGAYERQTVAGLTLVVDNATDENDGDYSLGDLSLREAVGLANGNVGADTITFAMSLDGVTQLLNGDLFGADGIVITESVTITGNGAANTIIDGNGGSLTAFTRIFDIPGDEDEGVGVNVDVTLDGLTLQNGRTTANFEDGAGGAIRSFADSDSALVVQNSTLRLNSTTGAYGATGGAIYSQNGNVTITRSTISGNSTGSDSAQYAHGGAIFAHLGNVRVTESTLSGNSASGFTSYGGAIYAEGGDVTVISSTLSQNSSGGVGGAIRKDEEGAVLILNSTLSGNSSGTNGGAIYAGGADITLINSTIVNNFAQNLYGGIATFSSAGSLSIYNSIIARNGTPFEASDLSITPVVLEHSFIGSNFGTSLTETGLATPDANGNYIGGDANSGTTIDPDLEALADNGGPTFTHALRSTSRALDSGDNALAVDELAAALTTDQRGAGFLRIFNDIVDMGAFESQALTLVVDNAADEDDGIYTPGDLSLREAVRLANTNLGFTDTIAFHSDLDGVTQFLNGDLFGHDGIAIIESVTITGNGAANTIIDGNGGSLTAFTRIFHILDDEDAVIPIGLNVDVTLDGLTLQNARNAEDHGGAVASLADPESTLTILNSRLTGNSSGTARGGAVYVQQGDVVITNSTFSGNSGNDGGALSTNNSDRVTVTNSTFDGNSSTDDGGAIWIDDAIVVLKGSTFSNNHSNGSGGAFFKGDGEDVFIINSTFSGNSADSSGGAIDTPTAVVTVVNSTIVFNTAGGDAGGILNGDSGTLRIYNSIIAGNTGDESADLSSTPTLLQNSLIGDNTGTGLTDTDHANGLTDGEGNFIGGATFGVIDVTTVLNPTLANNGGPTRTHALVAGSLALNSGRNDLAVDENEVGLTTDQRGVGFGRFVGTVDMGAYEAQTLTLVVDNADDEDDGNYAPGDLSLREAVRLANENVGVADSITFHSDLDGIELFLNATLFGTTGIDITDSVTITGNGWENTIIDGNEASRIFRINDGTSTEQMVAISGMTLQWGAQTGVSGVGGAIRNSEHLTLTDSRIANNTGYWGGAIHNSGTFISSFNTFANNTAENYGGAVNNDGTFLSTNDTFSDNHSDNAGGAVLNIYGATFTAINDTFSNNSADGAGGAIYAASGCDVVIINSTIAYNSADGGGGGINLFGSTLTIHNSIVALNIDGDGDSDILTDGGPPTVLNSLIGHSVGSGLTETGPAAPDLEGNYIGGGMFAPIDPALGPLQDNGGPTFTHALLPGSLALNSGDDALALDADSNPLTTDQRGVGFARIVGTVDMGAYEEQSAVALDFGDLPDTYGTTLASNGARHTATGPMLGTSRDTEADGQPNAAGTGDGADEDGLSADGPFIVGQTTNAHIFVSGGSGFVNAWVDLDRSGTFEAEEQFLVNHAVTAGNNDIAILIPSFVAPGEFATRFRLTSASVATPTPDGLLPDGEVEDYIGTIFAADFGDLPDSYNTTLANNGAQHLAVGPTLGATRDGELDGQPTPLADGDAADEDGISATGPLVAGVPTNLTINVQGGSGFVNAWVDANRDGDFDDPGELVLANLAVTTGDNVIPVLLPANFLPGPIATRFRLTSTAVATPTPGGFLPDGEVEDYVGVTTNPYLTIDGNTWNFHGTTGNDQVTVDLPNRMVTINGIVFMLLPNVTNLTVDGAAGNDRLTLIGTAGNEVVEIRPQDVLLLSSPSGLTLHGFDVEYNDVLGNGGTDTARFFDAVGVDRFSGRIEQSRMYGDGYDNVARGFAIVTATANTMAGGVDIAYLTDTAGDDLFSASYALASMSNTGISAENFEQVVGYSSGGNDKAILNGMAGQDIFLGRQSLSTLSQGLLSQGASGFAHVVAKPGGGSDIARLFGTALVDLLTAGPTTATLLSNNIAGDPVYRLDALGFETVIAQGAGDNDFAEMLDSAGPDDFYGRDNRAYIVGPGSTYEALDFSSVTIRGTAGGINRRHITQPLDYTLTQAGSWQ